MRRSKALLFLSVLTAFVPGVDAAPQRTLYEIVAPVPGSWFGGAVAAVGDVDGDGRPELFVGALKYAGLGPEQGAAYLYSGADGRLLLEFYGESEDDRFGQAISAAGDVDADGVPDLIVGAPDWRGDSTERGAAYVYRGSDGSLLHAIYDPGPTNIGAVHGSATAPAGDLDGDGYADFAVGAKLESQSGGTCGVFRVFSGRNASTLLEVFAPLNVCDFGTSLAPAGDVDGDGFVDLVVGATGGVNGSAYVYSLRTAELLHQWQGDTLSEQFGVSVDGVGDLDGDRIPDVLVGAWLNDGNGMGSGFARLYSGATGDVLRTMRGDTAGAYFGVDVSGGGDVDGDGVGDLVVGAFGDDDQGSSSGSARVFSGADGRPLYTFEGEAAGDHLGISVAILGDVDGDGYDDMVVGARGADRVLVFAGQPAVPICVCDRPRCPCEGHLADAPCGNFGAANNGCANGVFAAGCNAFATGHPSVSTDTLGLHAQSSVPFQFGLFVQGELALDGGDGLPFGDGLRCVGGQVVRLEIVAADEDGMASSTVDLAATGGVVPGEKSFYQWWYRDPGGSPCGSSFNLSNGLEVTWAR